MCPQEYAYRGFNRAFGNVSGELSEQIKLIDSREGLKDLLGQALRVKNFDELEKSCKQLKYRVCILPQVIQ